MAVAAYLTWWLSSPGAAWFLFLNVLVGAIAVTSRAQQRRCRAASSGRTLCRSASSMVLDRLRSFSIHLSGDGEWCWYRSPEADKIQVQEEWVPEPAGAVVEEPADKAPPANALAATEAADAAAALASGGRHALRRQNDEQEGSPTPPQQRQPVEPSVGVATAEATTVAVPPRPRQEEEAATVAEAAKPRRRARAYAAEVEGKAELNARAERFIRQFRQDLRLQRLNSIVGHTHKLSN